MSEDIPVIDMDEKKDEAMRMGYDRFEGADEIDFDETHYDPMGGMTDTAEWANIILPELRAMAGMEDSGHGTYQVDREVTVVEGSETYEECSARIVSGDLVEAYDAGAYIAMDKNHDESDLDDWF